MNKQDIVYFSSEFEGNTFWISPGINQQHLMCISIIRKSIVLLTM